ncbi:MAG: tRNA lysidine(34) synthetase TilS, partial [Thermomicrobiales bacterium]
RRHHVNPMCSEPSDDQIGRAKPGVSARPPRKRPAPHGLEQRLLARARDVGFARDDRLVVAFSGGRDSLALAAALRWTDDVLGIEPVLVHVDHRLRASSATEAARADHLANALDLPLQVLTVTEPLRQRHPHVGLEEAARRERYRLLFATAEQIRARAVATAHHEQDQAETVLLHLLRGGGVHGAVGMGERSAAPVPARSTSDISPENSVPWLWRPFLEESREAINEYVAALGLDWIEDSSNADEALRRNALRRRVLPLLEEQFPGATAALARYGRLAAADDEALEHYAQAALGTEVDPGGRFSMATLRNQPLGVQRRMVRRWLGQVTGSNAFTAERTDAVVALARGASRGGRIEIGEDWTVRREGGMLRVTTAGSEGEEPA